MAIAAIVEELGQEMFVQWKDRHINAAIKQQCQTPAVESLEKNGPIPFSLAALKSATIAQISGGGLDLNEEGIDGFILCSKLQMLFGMDLSSYYHLIDKWKREYLAALQGNTLQYLKNKYFSWCLFDL